MARGSSEHAEEFMDFSQSAATLFVIEFCSPGGTDIGLIKDSQTVCKGDSENWTQAPKGTTVPTL